MILTMPSRSLDTSRQDEQVMLDGFRRMPAREKLKRVAELTDLLHKLALNEIRIRHPEADERKLRLYLVSRWIAPELLKKAFCWDIAKEGY